MTTSDTGAAPKRLLLDRIRDKIRLKHYSIRTETAYVDWIRRFVHFHHGRHPRELGPEHVEAFLSHLAVQRTVAASTQNQAKSALLFLYREVLGVELPWLDGVETAKRPQRLPVVLSRTEVDAVLSRMRGTSGLIARLLYGSGLRLMEAIRLRVKDIELERREILVRDGKGAKDRVTMLPESLVEGLRAHLILVRELYAQDLAAGLPGVRLPHAMDRKYPSASREWAWQYVFPPDRLSIDPGPESGGATILTNRMFSARCARRSGMRAWRNRPRRTVCGTASPPT